MRTRKRYKILMFHTPLFFILTAAGLFYLLFFDRWLMALIFGIVCGILIVFEEIFVDHFGKLLKQKAGKRILSLIDIEEE